MELEKGKAAIGIIPIAAFLLKRIIVSIGYLLIS